MTPEEIVGLIGNIANRPDIREVQARQTREIHALLSTYRKAVEDLFYLCENVADFKNGNTDEFGTIDEGQAMAHGYLANIKKLLKDTYEVPTRRAGN
jgi:hypothetical protein